jgi:hypothetical protein
MILACDRGDSIELRTATSAARLGQPGSWHVVATPICFVNKIGLAALERGEVIRISAADGDGYATLAKLCRQGDRP